MDKPTFKRSTNVHVNNIIQGFKDAHRYDPQDSAFQDITPRQWNMAVDRAITTLRERLDEVIDDIDIQDYVNACPKK